MRKKILIELLILVACALSVFCRTGDSGSKPGGKEQADMFDIDGVSYPVRFVNFQQNSWTGNKIKIDGKSVRTKAWAEINPRLQIIPRDIYLNDDYLGIRAASVLMILDNKGEFLQSVPLGENTPVVFGKKAFAYLNHAYLLEYKDYDGVLRLETREFPAMGDFTELMLFRPTEDDYIAATYFTGGPHHETPYFDIYKIKIEETDREWSLSAENRLYQALLTSDETKLIFFYENNVTIINTDDGQIVTELETGLEQFLSASIDQDGNIVMIGKSDSGWLIKCLDQDGSLLWSRGLSDPKDYQPPVCGKNGAVYVADSYNVLCMTNGEIVWQKALPGGHPLITASDDGEVLILESGTLYRIDQDGEIMLRLALTDSGETFEALPVIDEKGRVYAAGAEKLYIIE